MARESRRTWPDTCAGARFDRNGSSPGSRAKCSSPTSTIVQRKNKDQVRRSAVLCNCRQRIWCGEFFQHLPEPNMKVIRHWGLYGARCHEELDQCREFMGQGPVEASPEMGCKDFCNRLGGKHPERCPECGVRLVDGPVLRPERKLSVPETTPVRGVRAASAFSVVISGRGVLEFREEGRLS